MGEREEREEGSGIGEKGEWDGRERGKRRES